MASLWWRLTGWLICWLSCWIERARSDRVLSKYMSWSTSLRYVVGSSNGVSSLDFNLVSLDMGVDACLHPRKPTIERMSRVYFLWLMLMSELFLATSNLRKYFNAPRSLMWKWCFNVFLNLLIMSKLLPSIIRSSI